MPLILAIEPDRRQATQLRSMVRTRLKADLVLADSAEKALTALGDRVPDLVLTSALLSPRDEVALDERLRALDGAAAHVQTLTIPVLATPSAQKRAPGVLSALRRTKKSKNTSPDGCDPAVFAEQCSAYLERAATEREEGAAADPGEFLAAEPVAIAAAEPDDIYAPLAEPEEAPAFLALPPAILEVVAPAVVASAPAPEVESEPVPVLKPQAMVPMWLGVKQLWPAMQGVAFDDLPAIDNVSVRVDEELSAPEIVEVSATERDEPLNTWEESNSEPLSLLPGAMGNDDAEELAPDGEQAEATATAVDEEIVVAPIHLVAMPAAADEDEERQEPTTDLRIAASEVEPEFYDVEIDDDPVGGDGLLTPLPISANQIWPALDGPTTESPVALAENEPPVAAAEPVRPEWLDVVESLRRDIERLRAERERPVAPPPPLPVAVGGPEGSVNQVEDVTTAPAAAKKRTNGKGRRGKASSKSKDEWGFFDPEQCGFGALLTKLDEVTEDAS
jgi:hypothetical protein